MTVLNVRHFSQLDNVYHPEGTCNLTSAAMCLDYHGIRPKKKGVQLEDELFEYVYDHKLSRHSAEDIAKVIGAFGCKDHFTWDGTIAQIKQSIDNGNPCIIHGMFTRSGHIIENTRHLWQYLRVDKSRRALIQNQFQQARVLILYQRAGRLIQNQIYRVGNLILY